MTKDSAKKNKKKYNKENNIKDLKEEKKQTLNKAKRDLQFAKTSDSDEIGKLIKIVLIVTAIMIIFYGITVIVTRKANAIKTAKGGKATKAEIQYDNVMIGSMLKPDGSYYVFIEKEDDDNSSLYDTLIKSVEASEDTPKIYRANLTDNFNSIYLGTESNYDSDLSIFKVTGTVLVKVSDHNIDSVDDNYDDIVSTLKGLE